MNKIPNGAATRLILTTKHKDESMNPGAPQGYCSLLSSSVKQEDSDLQSQAGMEAAPKGGQSLSPERQPHHSRLMGPVTRDNHSCSLSSSASLLTLILPGKHLLSPSPNHMGPCAATVPLSHCHSTSHLYHNQMILLAHSSYRGSWKTEITEHLT